MTDQTQQKYHREAAATARQPRTKGSFLTVLLPIARLLGIGAVPEHQGIEGAVYFRPVGRSTRQPSGHFYQNSQNHSLQLLVVSAVHPAKPAVHNDWPDCNL